MALSMSFRTTGTWGAGLGRNLTAAEVDTNFYTLKAAVEDLQDNPPAPNNIASITVDGLNMTVHLTDGTPLGPFPLPVLEFRWRAAWTPFTLFAPLDAFMVEGVGIFTVLEGHTSGATFDPALLVSGDPAYQKLFGADAGSAAVASLYDVDLYYPGRPADSTNTLLVDFILLRDAVLPIAAGNHYASLTAAPSTTGQVYPIEHDGAHLGDVTFAIGSDAGVFSWAIGADEAIGRGEHLQVGQSSTTSDPVACGLSIALALQRATA